MDFNHWTCISSISLEISEVQFYNAINIWITRANVLDKRVFCSEVFNLGNYADIEFFEKSLENLSNNDIDNIETRIMKLKDQSIKDFNLLELVTNGKRLRYSVLFQILRFRKEIGVSLNNLQLILIDFQEFTVAFFKPTIDSRNFNYAVGFDQANLKILVEGTTNQDQRALDWLSNRLLQSIRKWALSDQITSFPALSLISVTKYKETYDILKKRYFAEIKKVWCEVTDANKFIHEDLAIAAYLVVLWEGKKQTYVDLGCGNGLLVHILNIEGHRGTGYDVRARALWQKYPSSTQLKVQSLDPSDGLRFPDVDWIIGNHSDELTPWIPVIALRSSVNTNFFILPCCPYDFNGQKFRRTNTSKSQYADYLDYIQKVCNSCGYFVKRDKLRIPSTKRICMISFGRTFEVPSTIEENIIRMFQNCSNNIQETILDKKSCMEIKIRQPIEAVRNCTQLDQDVKKSIVFKLASIISDGMSCETEWNEGNPTSLKSLIQEMSPELLSHLRKESKGIQTFIKNYHHIFKIVDGMVTFRKPEVREVDKKHWKKSQCWFYFHHPHGCPLEDYKCSYRHSQESKNQVT